MKSSSEAALQRDIVAYLRAVLIDARVVHLANNPRGKIDGAKLKAMGLTKGLPDLMILRRGVARFIEIKTAKGTLSKEQKDFRDYCVNACFDWALCRSLDQVKATLEFWNIPTREAGG